MSKQNFRIFIEIESASEADAEAIRDSGVISRSTLCEVSELEPGK